MLKQLLCDAGAALEQNRALNLALEKERARVSQLSSEISAGGNGGAAAGVAFGDLDHDSVQVRSYMPYMHNFQVST
eukprot:365391-Chlamydomonas_euryale.AAC.14